jgi:rhamnogalacturonan acetylesterase
MMKTTFRHFVLLGLLLAIPSLAEDTDKKQKPTLYLVGDSTVKNGSGRGDKGLWGWGDFMYEQIDTSKISIVNKARGGRSSRTYMTEGLWDDVMNRLKPGDFVIIQFGHNDGGALNDNSRARGTIKGTGDEAEEIDNLLTGKHEVVHSYGWYLRKYISDAKSKGAIPIVCSLVARNIWKEGKVERATDGYTKWAAESAKTGGAFFIDLNDLTATRYESEGEATVKEKLFKEDHTHTSKEGAELNAQCVAEGISSLQKCPLNKYIIKNKKSTKHA